MKNLLSELKTLVSSVRQNEPMSRHTTLRVGGPAKFYAEVKTLNELSSLMEFAGEKGMSLFPVGQGSNLLVSDKGISGIVFKLSGDFKKIVVSGNVATAGAGALSPQLAEACAEKGLSGLEFLAGIPGTVGGALYMNAGLRDESVSNNLESVAVMCNGKTMLLKNKDMKFAYRRSILHAKKDWIVIDATFELQHGDKARIYAYMDELREYRTRTQPLGTYNAGSVFVNPKTAFAGQLIDAAGLKGVCVGGAKVSEKHCNFIVNTGKATSSDIRKLIKKIQQTVYKKFGTTLETEIKLV